MNICSSGHNHAIIGFEVDPEDHSNEASIFADNAFGPWQLIGYRLAHKASTAKRYGVPKTYLRISNSSLALAANRSIESADKLAKLLAPREGEDGFYQDIERTIRHMGMEAMMHLAEQPLEVPVNEN